MEYTGVGDRESEVGPEEGVRGVTLQGYDRESVLARSLWLSSMG